MEFAMIHSRIDVQQKYVDGYAVFYAELGHDAYLALHGGEVLEFSFRDPHQDIGDARFKQDFVPMIQMTITLISLDSGEHLSCVIADRTNQTILVHRA